MRPGSWGSVCSRSWTLGGPLLCGLVRVADSTAGARRFVSTFAEYRMTTTFPTSPPSLPVSQVSNYWLATWTPGTTLTAVPGFNNQLAANTTNVTLVGGSGDDTFVAYDPNTVISGGGGTDTVLTWGSGYRLPAGVANLTLEGSGNA